MRKGPVFGAPFSPPKARSFPMNSRNLSPAGAPRRTADARLMGIGSEAKPLRRRRYPDLEPITMENIPNESPELLRLVKDIVRTVLAELGEHPTPLPGGKLAVDEKEAAALLGLNSWQLRDLRREGRIEHHRIVGGRVRYTADHLRDYLARGQEAPARKRRRKPD